MYQQRELNPKIYIIQREKKS